MTNTRRRWLLLLVSMLLAGLDYGRDWFQEREGQPPGWKTERWQAGFGSWANGGYGVAYDISMPPDYDFRQSCGSAWITDDREASDFAEQFAFRPSAEDRRYDFDLYIKDDPARAFEQPHSPLKIGAATNVRFGPLRFARLDFSLAHLKSPGATGGGQPSAETASGFWLQSDTLGIISDLRDPAEAAINERIARTIRRANGYGLFSLWAKTIPGLLGC